MVPELWRDAVSRSDTPRSSGWVHWKAENFLLNFKKNPDEKYFSITGKFDFENLKIKIKKIWHFENLKFLYRKNIFSL